MPDESSVTQWISRLRGGDSVAGKKLWDGLFQRLLGAIKGAVGGDPARIPDYEEAAASALKTFLMGFPDGKYQDVKDRDMLWKLLVRIGTHKVIDLIRREGRQKRGGEAKRVADDGGGPGSELERIQTGMATPEFDAIMSETIDELFDRLNDPALQQLAIWKLEGYTNEEIAENQQRSVRTVERKLKMIRSKWSSD